MHFLRTHLVLPITTIALLSACETHDRVIYSSRPVKNLRVARTTTQNATPGSTGTTANGAPETVVINPSGPGAPSPDVPSVPPPAVSAPVPAQ